MAKTRKAAGRTAKTSSAKAGTSRSRRRTAKPARAAASGLFDFMPSNWIKEVMNSQTSRVIMAEALVAAAGAAAAVLVASRTESGQRAGQALADGGQLMKEAALSAAAAARDVIGKGATDAIGSAARSFMGAAEENQQDLAEKALRMRRDNEDKVVNHDVAERRQLDRERPHR